ncbi:armadillo repeat-containing protein 8-like [Pollicipes pollicipes]|uniref:armadillo repeat-containing protein 8-like n=1 Tax=Pollicipes pollicipes TaxID=41117 RepID=UPI0018856334|nr:armadillo repeat-containing protein 8-like [Pollicipes pollicipes]XP_037085760.1 armadillo repeat-containing protein 8-like [Pollicipes pollicipes]XP_037085761.1 armadillo repeat-containing protein 8-like [Pollicipes pollicipes]XP_037085762.1 armadillo repeat-containing protein 8-like [Pollicipes pollicipes]
MLEAVEGNRQFLDNFFSDDGDKCFGAIERLRNLVIGSNRTKTHVVECGMVPHLLRRVADPTVGTRVQVEILVTLGSLAKGTREHALALVDANILPLLVEGLRSAAPELRTPLLRCLRSLLLQLPERADELCRDPAAVPLLTQSVTGAVVDDECATTILAILCQSSRHQELLAANGVVEVSAALLASGTACLRLPSLRLLASLCYRSPAISDRLAHCTLSGRTVPDLLTVLTSRDQPSAVQLEAARCLSYMHRAGAGALPATDPRLVYRALPCLVRMCGPFQPLEDRVLAADTLGYLTEVDLDLQRICSITDHVTTTMREYLRYQPTTSHPKTCSHQRRMAVEMKKAAFRVYASLGSNDEEIRKRIIETPGLMADLLAALEDGGESLQLAALRCLLSLSRSVQTLRTALQDHVVWEQVMNLARHKKSSPDVRVAASSTLCNLLLEFSPSKEPLVQHGGVDLLCELTRSDDPAIRLNGIWALMNMAYQADHKIKRLILRRLGTNELFRLLSDPSTAILMKTLGLLRNLLTKPHVDQFMDDSHGPQVMQAIVLTLESDHPAEVKEQAICILANIADGSKSKEFIMGNEDVLKKLMNYMMHSSVRLRVAAVFAVNNLVWRCDDGSRERQARLRRMGVYKLLQQLQHTEDAALYERVKSVLQQFN